MKYIVAVSGGIDSVVLLHMLTDAQRNNRELDLVVAHVDHGLRHDSDADAWYVASLAKQYELPFAITRLNLYGKSEQEAREARYAWLESIKHQYNADGIITAHHQDDVLETIALNFMRGTGWRGLASLQSGTAKLRPLLDLSKTHIARYAVENGLTWREDSTNDDVRYTRNYIRHMITPKLDVTTKSKLAKLASEQRDLREKIESEVLRVVDSVRDEMGLSRHRLIMMPDVVSLEILRSVTHGNYEPFQLRRLLHFVKTGRAGAVLQLGRGKAALLTKQRLIV